MTLRAKVAEALGRELERQGERAQGVEMGDGGGSATVSADGRAAYCELNIDLEALADAALSAKVGASPAAAFAFRASSWRTVSSSKALMILSKKLVVRPNARFQNDFAWDRDRQRAPAGRLQDWVLRARSQALCARCSQQAMRCARD